MNGRLPIKWVCNLFIFPTATISTPDPPLPVPVQPSPDRSLSSPSQSASSSLAASHPPGQQDHSVIDVAGASLS